jgi:hypothetical protein
VTKLYTDPTGPDPVHFGTPVATVMAPALPDLEAPNYATTDVDPTPGSPRPLVATEPNYATTDVEPSPGSAPGGDVHGVPGGVVADPAVGTGRPDTPPIRGR